MTDCGPIPANMNAKQAMNWIQVGPELLRSGSRVNQNVS